MLLSNRPHKKAEKESNWGLKPHQDQWVMWEKRNCPTDAAFNLDSKTEMGTVSNLFGNYSAGEGPRATLHVRTHLCTISVRSL